MMLMLDCPSVPQAPSMQIFDGRNASSQSGSSRPPTSPIKSACTKPYSSNALPVSSACVGTGRPLISAAPVKPSQAARRPHAVWHAACARESVTAAAAAARRTGTVDAGTLRTKIVAPRPIHSYASVAAHHSNHHPVRQCRIPDRKGAFAFVTKRTNSTRKGPRRRVADADVVPAVATLRVSAAWGLPDLLAEHGIPF
ncbi:MAG TPA: hypothetical protein VF055_02980, partial [Steroidobacteraceae bacterium]